ncbi:Nucleoporin nup85 [Haplosporangium gracile]|nr:Nucleoporin nup85 [Haplosporangium gracile]
MSTGIPLIQPSNTALNHNAAATKRSIFSTPTEDLNPDHGLVHDMDRDQNDEEYVAILHLDPSPIKKGVSADSWAKTNRTLRSTFRPTTNEIAVYVAGRKAAEEFPTKQKSSVEDNAIFLCQAAIPESRIPVKTRTFIKQTFGVFLDIASKNPYKAGGSSDYKYHLERYNKTIEEHLAHLYVESKTNDTLEIEQETALMESFSAVWQLAEAVFLTSDGKRPIAFMFNEWLATHDASQDTELGKTLLVDSSKLTHPDFWSYIRRCLLRGMIESAIFILEQTLNDEEEEQVARALEDLVRVLKDAPSFEKTFPPGELHTRHMKWKEECKKFTQSKHVKHLGKGAKEVMKVLSCDVEEIIDVSDRWEEAVSGTFLFVHPDCERENIGQILEICLPFFLKSTDVTLLDRIKIAILQLDDVKTIRLCGEFHPWLVAHLSTVLQQYGYLDMSALDLQDIAAQGWDSNIHEFFVIGYAQSLMSNLSLWEIVAGYLLRCGHTGRSTLSEWICHVPLDSSEKAHKVLKFCEENDLNDSLRSINRVMAVEEEKRGEYSQAIQHFIVSKDLDRVAKVVDNLVLGYLERGQFDLDDTLESIEALDTTSSHVHFLRSYAGFHRDYKNGKLALAGEALIKLLSSGTVPKKYWIVLLLDALPLLENKQQVIFDSSDTFVLMRSLEELVGSQYRSEYLQLLPQFSSGSTLMEAEKEAQLDVLRLSLTRNLARSFVHPPRRPDEDVVMA